MTLLHFVKHISSNASITIQELSNIIDGANQYAFLEIHWVIKYVLSTRNLRLKLDKKSENKPYEIGCFVNSDPVRDSVTKKVHMTLYSLFGYAFIWGIKSTNKVDSVLFRSRMGSTLRGCEKKLYS